MSTEPGVVHRAALEVHKLKGKPAFRTKPVGSMRVNKGILQIKTIHQPGQSKKCWRSVHEKVWTDEHGPASDGHALVFKPGMRTTELAEIMLESIECITIAENMRRNFCINYPPELRDIIHLRGVLTKTINRRESNARTIEDLRELLFDTIEGVKAGNIDVERAKIIGDLSQVVVNSVRAEVEYTKLTGYKGRFLERPEELPKGVTGVHQHKLQG